MLPNILMAKYYPWIIAIVFAFAFTGGAALGGKLTSNVLTARYNEERAIIAIEYAEKLSDELDQTRIQQDLAIKAETNWLCEQNKSDGEYNAINRSIKEYFDAVRPPEAVCRIDAELIRLWNDANKGRTSKPAYTSGAHRAVPGTSAP